MKENKRPKKESAVYCPGANKPKLRFPTGKAARDFIIRNRLAIEKEGGYAPDHEYFCKDCGCYHVTSHEREHIEGRIEYNINPYLTVVFRKLTRAIMNLVIGKNLDGLSRIREAIPILFWELRLTRYKVEEKYLQKLMKELIKELGPEIKNLGKKKRLDEKRIQYYENKLLEIEEEGDNILYSTGKADTSHLSPILGRRSELGEEQFDLCLGSLQLIRKISAMSIIGARSRNVQKTWDELDEKTEQILDPQARALLERMKNLLY